MAKKEAPRLCGWCGTKLSRGTCPRGPQCAIDQADHDELLERIRKGKS